MILTCRGCRVVGHSASLVQAGCAISADTHQSGCLVVSLSGAALPLAPVVGAGRTVVPEVIGRRPMRGKSCVHSGNMQSPALKTMPEVMAGTYAEVCVNCCKHRVRFKNSN